MFKELLMNNRNVSTIVEKPNSMSIFLIIYYVRYYFLFALIPIGLLGNFISLLIFTRPNLNKKTNTGFLYSFLCVLNILTITEFAFIEKQIVFNYSVKLPCNMEFFVRKSLINSISWIQVLICFDRFLLVIFPLKSKIMSKKVNLCVLIRTNFKLILIINILIVCIVCNYNAFICFYSDFQCK